MFSSRVELSFLSRFFLRLRESPVGVCAGDRGPAPGLYHCIPRRGTAPGIVGTEFRAGDRGRGTAPGVRGVSAPGDESCTKVQ
jgi:hypothetical protein